MNGFPNSTVFTVSELNTHIRDLLAGSPVLNRLALRGEISNLRIYSSGHIYFTLKDEESSIPATMFNGAKILTFRPEDGMKVLCTGRVSVFVRDGQYRFYAATLQPDGAGTLAIAFKQLKEKLEKEGLLDKAHHKPIPVYPFRIGLITAPNGAAVRDLISVIRRRFPAAEMLLAPAMVQGPSAPAELIRALRLLDRNRLCDVIIIGRGGGSAEDLWCFNDEEVARAVAASEKPVVSGVGHEIVRRKNGRAGQRFDRFRRAAGEDADERLVGIGADGELNAASDVAVTVDCNAHENTPSLRGPIACGQLSESMLCMS